MIVSATPTAAIGSTSSTSLQWAAVEAETDISPIYQTAGRTAPLPAAENTPPKARTSADTLEDRRLTQSDLKQECQERPEARTDRGWIKNRFEQCFLGHRKVELKCSGCTTIIASVEFDYTLLGFAYDGSRRVDYVLTFDTWTPKGGTERETSIMRVALSGCNAIEHCSPSPAEREVPLGTWQQTPHFEATFTSPDTAGSGSYLISDMHSRMEMSIRATTPNIDPWHESNMSISSVRFDSAGAVSGYQRGTVFPDFVPTFDLWELAGQHGEHELIKESARHIDDALKHSERTFPSFVGKNIPGLTRPLHRITGPDIDENRKYSGYVCDDVWGPVPRPGTDCDEYPPASTAEGAYTSTSNGTTDWHGSARPITSLDNQRAGGTYLNSRFYNVHRILPADGLRPGDAFFVASSL